MATTSMTFMTLLINDILSGLDMKRTISSNVNQMMHMVSIRKNVSVIVGKSSSMIVNVLFVLLENSAILKRLKFGNVSKQNMTMLVKITVTDIMATRRAHCEVSGYSNKSQSLR